MNTDPRDLLARSPMSRLQMLVVALWPLKLDTDRPVERETQPVATRVASPSRA